MSHLFDDLVTGIRHGVNGMPETDDHFLRFKPPADIGFGFIRVLVSLLDFERDFVRASVLLSAERSDSTDDRRIDVGAGGGYNARRERGGIEFVLGIKRKGRMHSPYPRLLRRLAVENVKKMPPDRLVAGLNFNPPAVHRIVVPIQQHG